ncbi:MAG: hypothetical protein Q9162_001447 [Coniocarpon cinnabarinum]
MASFEVTDLNKVKRKGQRGNYDHATVHNLIDKTPVLHVAFNPPPPSSGDESPQFPVILPMLGCTGSYSRNADPDAELPLAEARNVYLHGYVSARLMRLPETANVNGSGSGHGGDDGSEGSEGVPLTVSATLLDGIILAATPFNHSCNYRSAVVFGHAVVVTDEAEKNYAVHRITNNLVPHRWQNARLPDKSELATTGVLRVDIHSASAKIHVGGPSIDRKDLKDKSVMDNVWTGVVPTWIHYGDLMEGNDNQIETPSYLTSWIDDKRNQGEKEAMQSLRDEKGKLGVKLPAERKRGWFGGFFGGS